MDVISLSKATKTLKEITELNNDIIGQQAEDRFKTVDHRLDWIEGQADKLLIENSHQVSLSEGIFENVELVNGKLQLKLIRTAVE